MHTKGYYVVPSKRTYFKKHFQNAHTEDTLSHEIELFFEKFVKFKRAC